MRFRCVIVWPYALLDAQLANVTSRSQRHAFAAPLTSTTPRHLDNPGTSSTQHSLGRRPLARAFAAPFASQTARRLELPSTPFLLHLGTARTSSRTRSPAGAHGRHLDGSATRSRGTSTSLAQHVDPARSAPRYRALHLSAPLAS
ncbi:hypothetical protein K438DRAFT_1991552 [Mycena galopus ATCC 62051]|nr:hypothetical protein K438DRAFT_1991552 [Mycena galopus ATCC 62051]